MKKKISKKAVKPTMRGTAKAFHAMDKAAVKAEPKVKAVQSTPPAKLDATALQVLRDRNGVAYLQVASDASGASLIVNKGNVVELVKMDNKTMKSLYLQPVPNANVLYAVKLLLRPLSASVTISQRAATLLSQIQNDKEIIEMQTKKFAKKANAPASKGGSKTAKTTVKRSGTKHERVSRLENQTVTLKRMPKDGNDKDHIPEQAGVILTVLQAKGKKLAVSDLVKALDGKLKTKQPVTAIWAFYRKALIDKGFITVEASA